jgi:TRAP-type C4-dicarboxylate transport system permease small subunit
MGADCACTVAQLLTFSRESTSMPCPALQGNKLRTFTFYGVKPLNSVESPMLSTVTKHITRLLLAIGATVLALMMFLTALDVVLRYLFNRPLAGAFELVEYMMAVFIPFSIAYCADQKGHVAVELILGRLPKKAQSICDIATTFVTMLFAIAIAWENVLYIGEIFASKLTSAVLLIPTYPFVAPAAIGIATFALILMVRLFEFFSGVKKR